MYDSIMPHLYTAIVFGFFFPLLSANEETT